MKLFSDSVNGNYKRIHAFELDEDNFRVMKKNVAEMHDVILHAAGVGDKNETITYALGNGDNEPTDGISIMRKEGRNKRQAKIVRMDDVLIGEEITMIKMDIEGSELAALHGAKRILQDQKPQLAVCVYHKTSDFCQIPLLIKSFNSEYRIFMRHHCNRNCWGTVMYAV